VADAAYGFSGFDSFFLNIYTHLIMTGNISYDQYNMLTSFNPASLLSVPSETIEVGSNASFMVIKKGDYILNERDLLSKGKNNPFIGKKFAGRIEMVVKEGRIYRRRYRK
jgi:dihydroorotase